MENGRWNSTRSSNDYGPTGVQKEGRKLVRKAHSIGEVKCGSVTGHLFY
jgi:hypothetical protein